MINLQQLLFGNNDPYQAKASSATVVDASGEAMSSELVSTAIKRNTPYRVEHKVIFESSLADLNDPTKDPSLVSALQEFLSNANLTQEQVLTLIKNNTI
jgi:hypothetical protein